MEESDSRQDGRVTDHDSPRAISRQQGIQLIFAGRLNLGWRRRRERLAVVGRQRLRQPPVPERPLVVIDDRCRIGVSRRQRGCGADIDLRHGQIRERAVISRAGGRGTARPELAHRSRHSNAVADGNRWAG